MEESVITCMPIFLGIWTDNLFLVSLLLSHAAKIISAIFTLAQSFSCPPSPSQSASFSACFKSQSYLSVCVLDSHSCSPPPFQLYLILRSLTDPLEAFLYMSARDPHPSLQLLHLCHYQHLCCGESRLTRCHCWNANCYCV